MEKSQWQNLSTQILASFLNVDKIEPYKFWNNTLEWGLNSHFMSGGLLEGRGRHKTKNRLYLKGIADVYNNWFPTEAKSN